MATRKASRKTQGVGFPRRGDIYLVDSETRPALIVQKTSPTSSPSWRPSPRSSMCRYPTEVILEPGESGLPQRSSVLLNQIKRIGHASPGSMQRVDQAIEISLGLVRI
jgi:mRNA-degrading endonuclease toxin of MazEF toxin-antitoxin module